MYWQGWGIWKELCTRFLDALYRDYPHRLVSLEQLSEFREKGLPSSLFRFDHTEMKVADYYEFPKKPVGDFLGSIQFVPRKNGTNRDTDGFVVALVLTADGCQVWIFDGANLAQGPLCKLTHPWLSFGYTLHATFLPELKPRKSAYYVPVREDLEEQVTGTMLPGVGRLFEIEDRISG